VLQGSREPAGRYHTFERAVYLTVAWAFVPIVWLYAVGFPTRDLRARLPWLMGGAPVVLGIFLALGGIAVALTGARLRPSLGGIVAGALLGYLVLASGVMGRVLPADYDSPTRPALVGLSTAIALGALWWQRREVRDVTRGDRERAV
jgi:hypothetical protein